MRNLLREGLRRHGVFLFTCMVLFAAFEFLVCAVISKVNLSGAIDNLLISAPAAVRELVKEQFFGGFTAQGMVAFGWNHPVAHALGGAVAIVLAARAVAGEIGQGTLELVLAQPLSRLRYLAARAVFGVSALVLLAAAGTAGTFAGHRAFDLEPLALSRVLALAASFFLIQAAWFGLALAVSAWGREASQVSSIVFSAAVISFVIQVIGRLWSPAASLLPFSLYHYHAPEAVLREGAVPATAAAVLLTVTLAGLVLAYWRFLRRDIP